jgi:hypothetical protein
MMGVRKITSFGTSVSGDSGKKVMHILHGRHSDYICKTYCIYNVVSSGFNMIDCTLSFIHNYSIEWEQEYLGIYIFHLHFLPFEKKDSLVMQYAEQT